MRALENEVSSLEDQLETRRLVDRAKGILMDDYAMKEADAFSFIQRNAMQQRVTMRVLAQRVIDNEIRPEAPAGLTLDHAATTSRAGCSGCCSRSILMKADRKRSSAPLSPGNVMASPVISVDAEQRAQPLHQPVSEHAGPFGPGLREHDRKAVVRPITGVAHAVDGPHAAAKPGRDLAQHPGTAATGYPSERGGRDVDRVTEKVES